MYGYVVARKKIAIPFQEGVIKVMMEEKVAYTDYRWNDGTVSRLWHVDPASIEQHRVELRPMKFPQANN